MSYSGYNQEDSILFNKSSLDRGLFGATIYHTEKDEDKKIQGDEEIRCKADRSKTKGMKFANYDKLNDKGVIPENTLVENGDIIIGKVVPIKENRNDHTKVIKYKDQSRVYRTHEELILIKIIFIEMVMDIHLQKLEPEFTENLLLVINLVQDTDKKELLVLSIPEANMPFNSSRWNKT